MESEAAVKRMMAADIKQNLLIPPQAYPAIRDALALMYRVGYEQCLIDLSHPKRVGQYTKDGKFIREYQSISHAARAVDSHPDSIQRVANGRKGYITAKGYVWKYMNETTASTGSNGKPVLSQSTSPQS